jgi:hypothetical protein
VLREPVPPGSSHRGHKWLLQQQLSLHVGFWGLPNFLKFTRQQLRRNLQDFHRALQLGQKYVRTRCFGGHLRRARE